MIYKPFQGVVWSHILRKKVIPNGRRKFTTDTSPPNKGKGNVLREAAGVIPGPAPVSAKGRPKGL